METHGIRERDFEKVVVGFARLGGGTLFTNFEWARWIGRNGGIAAKTVFSWDAVARRVARVYTQ